VYEGPTYDNERDLLLHAAAAVYTSGGAPPTLAPIASSGESAFSCLFMRQLRTGRRRWLAMATCDEEARMDVRSLHRHILNPAQHL
jgi:hypothetical protein